jgi:hypothetical protein
MGYLEKRRRNRGGIVLGVWLILLGVVLVLHTTGIAPWPHGGLWWLTIWALILITLGISRLLAPTVRRRDSFGFLFVGSWLLLNQLHVLRYRDSWPIVLVGIGIGLVWSALARRPAKSE